MTNLLLAVAIIAGLVAGPKGGNVTQPDVVVIVFDDMRTEDWAALPQTRALVDGTWYPNYVIPTPVCCPGRATLLTGQYAHNHGVHKNKGRHHAGRGSFRPHEDHTLATALQGAGYYTVLVGKYLNGYDKDQADPPGWDDFHAVDPPTYGDQVERLADFAVAEATLGSGSLPMFLWYAPKAPHGPLLGLKGSGSIRPRHYADYDAARKAKLAVQDQVVADIASAMGPRWATAVVVVVSDNGYLLGEHGHVGKGVPYSGAVNVPAMVRVPHMIRGQDLRLASAIDIAPTILLAAGVDADWVVDGRPLQEFWDRQGVLIEGWGKSGQWYGVRTHWQTYVHWGGATLYWDRITNPGEATFHGAAGAPDWDAWLADLRDCAGDSCRVHDLGPSS